MRPPLTSADVPDLAFTTRAGTAYLCEIQGREMPLLPIRIPF